MEERLRVRTLADPLADGGPRGKVPAMAVHDQDPVEPLPVQRLEQVAHDRDERLDAKRRAARIRAERRRQAVRQDREDGHGESEGVGRESSLRMFYR